MQDPSKTELDTSKDRRKMISLSLLRENGFQRLKTMIYTVQALLVSIAWILALAVLTKSGTTGSATKFYFTLVSYVPRRCTQP